MPICAELVHSVTLLAQPRDKHPLVKKRALKSGRIETKNRGTFGLLWFTDFGEKFWEACQSIDDNAKLRLRSSGFDEMDWSVSFRFAGFKARITSQKYKGFFGTPRNAYIELKLGCQNPNDLRMFVQALSTKFDNPPWVMNNWNKVELASGMNQEDVINAWSQAMGREITPEETKTKGWGLPSFGSKKTEVKEDTTEFEIFEDGDGNEIKMKIHGALEVEGDEYAIMSYADSIISEFEIMKIKRGRGGKISYSGIDDEQLYEDLSEAAAIHLESSGAL
mgnify:FL=1|tara:strand:+ start:157 stop:990 length:834 start_codon:yes stop_codon:yes gene_type:complete